MIVTAALAAPWSSIPPLQACGDPDRQQQQVLLSEVRDLAFDGEGRLWVADAGSLTMRDDALDVLEAPAPGAHGWTRITVDGTRVQVDNALGSGWSSDGRPVGQSPEQGRDRRSRRSNEGVQIERGRLLARGTPLDLPKTGLGGAWTTPERGAAWERLTGHPLRGLARVEAVAYRKQDGLVALATTRGLYLFDASGKRLAERPVVGGADAVGLHEGRLFTVFEGVLAFHGPRGSVSIPGVYSGATVHRGRLLAAGTDGRLWEIPADGPPRERACLYATCDLRYEPLPTPLTHEDPGAVIAAAKLWAANMQAWLDVHPPQPSALLSVGEHLVVAKLDGNTFEQGDVLVRELVVLDSADAVVATRSFRGVGEPGHPRGLDGQVVVGAHTRSVPDLDFDDPRYAGPAVSWTKEGLTVGWGVDGTLIPSNALMPRWTPQHRSDVVVSIEGTRLVVAGPRGAHAGPVEVWCVPGKGGSPRTNRPGVLALRDAREDPTPYVFEGSTHMIGFRVADPGHTGFFTRDENRAIVPWTPGTETEPRPFYLLHDGFIRWSGSWRLFDVDAFDHPIVLDTPL